MSAWSRDTANRVSFSVLLRRLHSFHLKELSSFSVRKDNNKDCCGKGGYQEKSPKQPFVNYLRQHPPFAADEIVFVLLILLLEEEFEHLVQILVRCQVPLHIILLLIQFRSNNFTINIKENKSAKIVNSKQ